MRCKPHAPVLQWQVAVLKLAYSTITLDKTLLIGLRSPTVWTSKGTALARQYLASSCHAQCFHRERLQKLHKLCANPILVVGYSLMSAMAHRVLRTSVM
eukprot:scaffold1943_cov160-Amphora_coffeaeformis.AAC.5